MASYHHQPPPTSPTLRTRFSHSVRHLRPYLPKLTRLLLVSSFLETGLRSLIQVIPSIATIHFRHGLPLHSLLSFLLILFISLSSILGSLLIVSNRSPHLASFILLTVLLLQYLILTSDENHYKHRPGGYSAVLLRDICLAGCILLVGLEKTLRESLFTALPSTIAPSKTKNRIKAGDSAMLLARIILGSLSYDLGMTFQWSWTFWITIGVPVAFLIVGWYMEVMAPVVMVGYLGCGLRYLFEGRRWMTMYRKEELRLEFVQNVSVLGGLMLLISLGPGMLSLDAKLRKKNT